MLISILVVLLVLCLAIWLIQKAPTPSPDFPIAMVKWIATAIAVVIACGLILKLAGIGL